MSGDDLSSEELQEISAKEIAEIAARFLPAISLEDWDECTSPADLERVLREEFIPGYRKIENNRGVWAIEEELPSKFEVLAEVAVKRARILLKLAAGEKREKLVARERELGKQRAISASEWRNELRQDFQRSFGCDDTVSLKKAFEKLFPRITSKVREEMLKRWIQLSKSQDSELDLSTDPLRLQKRGVDPEDYWALKMDEPFLREKFHKACQKAVQRREGSKGGKKSQSQSR